MPSERLVAEAEAFLTNVQGLSDATSETVASYSLDSVRRMPLDELDAGWREAETKIWPASAFARRKVRKLLQTFADNGAVDPAVDLKALFKMRERDAAIRDSAVARVAQTRGGLDAARATHAVCQAIEFRPVVANLHSEVEDPVRFESATSQLVSATGGSAVDALKDYLVAEEAVAESTRIFTLKGGVISDESSVADLDRGLEILMAERARLPDWALWVKASRGACDERLLPLVEALESGMIEGSTEEAFERAYAAWWLPLAMDASPALLGFTRSRHETVIAAFRKLDDAAARHASVEVMRRIAHGLPCKAWRTEKIRTRGAPSPARTDAPLCVDTSPSGKPSPDVREARAVRVDVSAFRCAVPTGGPGRLRTWSYSTRPRRSRPGTRSARSRGPARQSSSATPSSSHRPISSVVQMTTTRIFPRSSATCLRYLTKSTPRACALMSSSGTTEAVTKP